MKQFHKKHDLICTVFRTICEKNVYSKIENIKNVVNVWNYLKQMFKFKETNFFNNAFRQFENFTVINCSSFANYVFKFRHMLNKFKHFFSSLSYSRIILFIVFTLIYIRSIIIISNDMFKFTTLLKKNNFFCTF